MQLDNVNLIDRYNRPGVGAKVAVRTQFLNNGVYFDPYDISACTIFASLANDSPNSILDSATQIIKEGVDLGPTGVAMNFGISGNPVAGEGHKPGQATSQHLDDPLWFPTYVPGVNASGIYRVSSGDYVCVLDGGIDLSGGYNMYEGYNAGQVVENSASSTQEYIDVWTVKLRNDSDWQVFINTFTLYNDTFLTLTEPLILNTSNRLTNKHLYVGGKEDIIITTDITVGNRNLSEEVKNIIQDYSITDVTLEMNRIIDGGAIPSVSNVSDTFVIRVTGDNTIIFNFDASDKTAGTYVLQVNYQFLNQTIQSQPMYFTLS